MAERGIDLEHTTILRWERCYVPEFEKKWDRYARPVGSTWPVDKTYIRVKGEWTYLYRAVISREHSCLPLEHCGGKALFHAGN
jgi:transposase-like protein